MPVRTVSILACAIVAGNVHAGTVTYAPVCEDSGAGAVAGNLFVLRGYADTTIDGATFRRTAVLSLGSTEDVRATTVNLRSGDVSVRGADRVLSCSWDDNGNYVNPWNDGDACYVVLQPDAMPEAFLHTRLTADSKDDEDVDLTGSVGGQAATIKLKKEDLPKFRSKWSRLVSVDVTPSCQHIMLQARWGIGLCESEQSMACEE